MACFSRSKIIGLAAALAVTGYAAGAAAVMPRVFDVKGFTQGMHKRDAREVARRSGYEMHESDKGTVITKDGHADAALFCRDELVRYAYTATGGFMKFLREIGNFEKQGFRRTNLDLGTQMGADGKQFGHLGIYLFRPGDYYFVTVTLLGTEDYDTDNYTIGYEALDKGAKCGR